ncbi:MAG: YbaK/EbsC family protein [Planctomycetaceae bacterium]|jgi:Ala-tRNA(Pro) deacylase|nr:YbaK/EbsC family protein [Planctomycetaceae bacterium]MBV8606644.1 YbaK/EbsC family protein [Singulisphaera sp.]MBV8318251.1 YbaK/EbsC family protein [Planctomycetaceae bacterium]MBV8383136.1 YbaK/EbsC family protein [Planctomycetaceae bacterium]MBV8555336.1 YbaK/EbsC family protein [Planctomycetaceae bacterium]
MSIRDYLHDRYVWFEVFLHTPAPSATRRARSVRVSGHQVAKAVLIRSGDRYALAVLPATCRIDLERLAQVLGGPRVRIATEDEVERVFGDCERGALPPFGRPYGLKTVVDSGLALAPVIVFVGNARHEGIRMRYRDYEAVEAPVLARIALTIAPRRPSRALP